MPVELRSAAPVLPVLDLAAAVEHYRRLGFAVETYDGDEAYAFAERGQVSLHLSETADHDPLRTASQVYLYVEDADGLYAEWAALDVGGRLHRPVDTPYGLREGAHVDPNGNLLRFGATIIAA